MGTPEGIDDLSLTTHAERPELLERLNPAVAGAFPEFLLHDQVWNECWPQVLEAWPELQVLLVGSASGDPVAMVNAVALTWDGSRERLPAGTHAALRESLRGRGAGMRPNAACAIQAVLDPASHGRGLGAEAMRAFLANARSLGYERLISPIRPTAKHDYPTVPLERYAAWSRADGLPFDPWLRVQARIGGAPLAVCPGSVVIEAGVADWEAWTGLAFPEGGEYVIPSGQVPVHIDRTLDQGRYAETHIWFEYGPQPER